MVNFPKTIRTDMDLALTRGKGEQFDFETLQRIKVQRLNYNYQKAEQQRQRLLKKNKLIAKKAKTKITGKVQNIESQIETINLDLADKISKIIPYSLIPIIPLAIGFLIIKRKK
jgi:hypothetical protein